MSDIALVPCRTAVAHGRRMGSWRSRLRLHVPSAIDLIGTVFDACCAIPLALCADRYPIFRIATARSEREPDAIGP